jgi:O-antigen/teichoic acid export membrane protein
VATIRLSLLWVSIGQYVNLALSFLGALFLARLLTPAEYGVSVLGWAVLGIAEALREIASGAFLVRERELSADKIRSSVTIGILATVIVAGSLMMLARPLSDYFATPGVDEFLYVAIIGFAMGAILSPQQALLNRELAYSRLVIIGCVMTAVGSVVSITLAYQEFAALSLAWASVASAATGTILSIFVRWDATIYRPSLRNWRSVISFGAHSGATAIISKVGEAVPVFIFGKVLSPSDVAIGSRTVIISLVAERIVYGPVLAIALPEFSRQVREGRDLNVSYFSTLSLITVIHWPAMIMLALLARPVVALVIGHQWVDVVPLLRIYCPALMLAVPIGLQYAVLSAADGVHLLPRLLAAQTAALIVALALTARHGLVAAAWSMYAVFAVSSLLSLLAVRSRIGFRWRDLAACLAPSVAVAFLTTIGPLALFLFTPSMTPLISVAMIAVASIGWIIGLYVSSHPMWSEIVNATTIAMNAISRQKG